MRHQCDINEICTNTAGSYECGCQAGFVWECMRSVYLDHYEVVRAYKGETYQYFWYKVLNLTNSQITTILYINFSDVNYFNNMMDIFNGSCSYSWKLFDHNLWIQVRIYKIE